MSSADGSSVSARVAELGQEIRRLKESLKAQGLSGSAVNKHELVLAKVSELSVLKAQLDVDDPATDAAFFARQKAEAEEKRRQELRTKELQQTELKDAEKKLTWPKPQRKIHHLFCCAGNGDAFHYEPPARLNDVQTGFGTSSQPTPAVYVTEKWDGTTMQATSRGIFKRIDIWGTRKHGQNPADRYSLTLLAWRDSGDNDWRGLDFIGADARYAEALHPHLSAFAQLPDDICIYFELVHTDVNATFKCLPNFADIRVFDSACRAELVGGAAPDTWHFLPFGETIQLSERLGLPIVGWEHRDRLDVAQIWVDLAAAKDQHYATAVAPIEGFVVREATNDPDDKANGGRIAKARVEHLRCGVLKPSGRDAPCSGDRVVDDRISPWAHLRSTAPGASLGYLEQIGLPIWRA